MLFQLDINEPVIIFISKIKILIGNLYFIALRIFMDYLEASSLKKKILRLLSLESLCEYGNDLLLLTDKSLWKNAFHMIRLRIFK